MKDISPVKQAPPPQTTPSHFLLTSEKMPQSCINAVQAYKAPPHRFSGDLSRSIASSLISPQKNLFLQTNGDSSFPEDLDSDTLIPLSPNLTDEEYLFTLTDTEGITDLFDSYNLWNDA